MPTSEMMTLSSGNETTTQQGQGQDGGLISDAVASLIDKVVDAWINSIISYVGIIGNVILIVVFRKLGFQEAINISMTFIASWDLARSVLNVIYRLHAVLDVVASPATALSYKLLHQGVFNYASGIAGYVSCCLAGYVAVERCLCVSLPFTVKYVLTPRFVCLTNTMLSVLVCASLVIYFPCVEIYSTFSPYLNDTVTTWRFNSLWTDNPVDDYLNAMLIAWIVLSFVVICISTVVITYHMKKSSSFRSSSAVMQKGGYTKRMTGRERQVTRVLLLVIGTYIVTTIPRILFFLVRFLVPDFDHYGRYHNSLWVSVNVMNIFDFINIAANPFIFYFMSSQFRSVFLKTFCCCYSHERQQHEA